jgi:hypothetical protein
LIAVSISKAQGGQAAKLERHFAFHPAARRDHPGGGYALHHARRRTFHRDAACNDCALCDGIDLPVGPVQRRHHQRAAQQAFRIADGRYRHVDLPARPRERRQGGGDKDGGHVLGTELFAGDVDAQAFQQGGQHLFGEWGIAQAVAGGVQAHDQAVAHQIVAAHPVEFDQILQPHRRADRKRRQQAQQHQGKQAHHRMKSTRLRRARRAVMA